MESQKPKEDSKKKVWVTPKLIVYGDIEKITTEKPIGITASSPG